MRYVQTLATAVFALAATVTVQGAGISNWKELCENRPETVGCDPTRSDNPASIADLEARLRAEIEDGAGSFWCWSNCIRITASVDAIIEEAVQERRARTIEKLLGEVGTEPDVTEIHPTAEQILAATSTTRADGPAVDGLLGQGDNTELAAIEREKARKETDRREGERRDEQLFAEVESGMTVGEIAVEHRSRIGAEGQPLWGDTGLVKAIEDYNFWYNPELVSDRAKSGAKWDANRIGPDDVLKVPPKQWVAEWYANRTGGQS